MINRFSVFQFFSFSAFAAIAVLWLPIIYLLSAQWSIYEQYRYGWAVPFLCAYLFWKRAKGKSEIAKAETLKPGSSRYISVFQFFSISAFCLLLLPTRVLQEANPLWRFASYALAGEAIVITLALIYFAGGFRALRNFAFPVCFFLVAVPWPSPVEVAIINSLTRLNTAAVMEVTSVLGIPALARGNVIEVSTGLVGVDEACSGIRSTQAVFMLALFFGELHRLCVRGRLGLLVSGLVIALVLNIVRTSILVILAARGGIALSQKWHDTTGITVLLGCFLLVWALATCLAGRRTTDNRPRTFLLPASSSALPAPGPAISASQLFSFSAFRESSLLPVCIAVLTCSLLSVIGSELWFRTHEREHAADEQWTISLPRERSAFRETNPSNEVKGLLQYDQVKTATWQNKDGTVWQFFHFRWEPATRLKDRVRVQLAKSHRPEACLPAGGWKLREEFQNTRSEIAGIPLIFRSYEFTMGPRSVFVFFCVREDGTGSAAANMRESHAVRWRAAWEGNRGLGQRSIEIAISGARDLAQAQASLQTELPQLIRITHGDH